jgi:iron complex transport system substrate-binding protein
MSLNDTHLVSEVIRLCGGQNIFGHLSAIAPTVNIEALLQADPEVILSGSSSDDTTKDWQRFGSLTAVRRANLFKINSDWMARPGPRILDAAQRLCEQLDSARAKRNTQ